MGDDDVEHLLAISTARDSITEALMNIRDINSTSEVSQLLASQNMDTSAAGSMAFESTDISPSAVMAQLRRLRRSDPTRFKAVISSISGAIFSGNTTVSGPTKIVVAASETDRTFVMAPQTRRWPVTLFGGAALVGFATLMLLRPSHYSAGPSAMGMENFASGSGTIVRTTAPGRMESLKKTEPIAPGEISDRTSAGAPALSPVAGAQPVANPLLLATTSRTTEVENRNQKSARRTTSSPTTKAWSSDERWLAH
jgi:hypothetical protein